ncbi:hypothetical protein K501DRAFT_311710 [Backusella circina FSU 941]|nr:hypothetical protein K501DRAFT_311710 [Backusella circina FSU 941]
MRPLPAEILTEIFLYLDQHEKVKCLLVCNRWKQVMEQSALYHTVFIHSVDALDKLTTKVQQQVDIKNKIEQLVLLFAQNGTFYTLRVLLPLLSNLKSLINSNTKEQGQGISRDMINEQPPYPWHRHIQYMSEQSILGFAHRLLTSGTCWNLTTLEMYGLRNETIPYLKNAPALKYLTVVDTSLVFDDLEYIHDNLPCLKSLKFFFLKFLDSVFDHHNIQPATTVTECVFDLLQTRDTKWRIALLVYMHKKYPNMTQLTYNINIDRITDAEIEDIIQLGWYPFFNKMGHQLKKLCVDYGGYITNLFETLDRYACQLEYLKVSSLTRSEFTKITQSKQTLHIQSLTLMQMDLGSFSWLKELKHLSKLSLVWNFLRTPVRLNDILDNACARLKSLSFDFMDLTFDLDCAHLSNIDSLSFHLVSFPKNMDVFISRHFPKLRTLKMSNCNQLGKTFNLGPIHLVHFYFTEQYQGPDITVLIVSTKEEEQCQYNLRGSVRNKDPVQYFKPPRHAIFPVSKSWVIKKKTDSAPDFTFICHSVKNVDFN